MHGSIEPMKFLLAMCGNGKQRSPLTKYIELLELGTLSLLFYVAS